MGANDVPDSQGREDTFSDLEEVYEDVIEDDDSTLETFYTDDSSTPPEEEQSFNPLGKTIETTDLMQRPEWQEAPGFPALFYLKLTDVVESKASASPDQKIDVKDACMEAFEAAVERSNTLSEIEESKLDDLIWVERAILDCLDTLYKYKLRLIK